MRNLALEEIQGKLESFPESFKQRFGEDLRPELVLEILQDQLDHKERQLIKEAFSDLTPQNIRMVIDELNLKAGPRSRPRKGKAGDVT